VTASDLPAAIFFDLDDTILDDSANVFDGWRIAVEAHGRELAGFDLEAL
jgi:hypothetical protein